MIHQSQGRGFRRCFLRHPTTLPAVTKIFPDRNFVCRPDRCFPSPLALFFFLRKTRSEFPLESESLQGYETCDIHPPPKQKRQPPHRSQPSRNTSRDKKQVTMRASSENYTLVFSRQEIRNDPFQRQVSRHISSADHQIAPNVYPIEVVQPEARLLSLAEIHIRSGMNSADPRREGCTGNYETDMIFSATDIIPER